MVGAVMPVVIGRDAELALLDELAGRAHRGHGQIVVISGEAGIGKSRMAAEVLIRRPDLGFTVYSGAADEVERRRPFGVVTDALGIDRDGDAVRAEVAELLDGAAHRGRYGVEARIADLLDTVVGEACSRRPVALILDDLQWADESSMVATKRIAGSAAARPLLLVCVLRPYPTDLGLRALLAALDYRGAQRIDLEGLPVDRAAELATLIGGAPPGRNLRRMLAETGGNPLYIGQLLAGLGNGHGGRISEAGLLEVDAPSLLPR